MMLSTKAASADNYGKIVFKLKKQVVSECNS